MNIEISQVSNIQVAHNSTQHVSTPSPRCLAPKCGIIEESYTGTLDTSLPFLPANLPSLFLIFTSPKSSPLTRKWCFYKSHSRGLIDLLVHWKSHQPLRKVLKEFRLSRPLLGLHFFKMWRALICSLTHEVFWFLSEAKGSSSLHGWLSLWEVSVRQRHAVQQTIAAISEVTFGQCGTQLWFSFGCVESLEVDLPGRRVGVMRYLN